MTNQNVILIVDDHPTLLNSLSMTLEHEGFTTVTATDGQDGLAKLQQNEISLILADVAMPNLNGYQFFEMVRKNKKWLHIPFVFLTARSLDSDVRYGKELGADDYLVKPIEPEDLLAVIKGKLKRHLQFKDNRVRHFAPVNAHSAVTAAPAHTAIEQIAPQTNVIKFGDIEINPGQHQVWLNAKPIRLSAREFRLLERLLSEPGQLIHTEELLLATHGFETSYQDASNLIRPLIRTLRQKLGLGMTASARIETVRGIGYRFISR